MLSWNRDSTNAANVTFYKRTTTCASSIHTYHTPFSINALHSYPPVMTPQIFTYETSDPPLPLHDSSAESVTPKGNPTLRNNLPNLVPNVPSDPDSDPVSSDSYLYYSYDS